MNYKVICLTCRAYIWIRGIEEGDTNALVLNENDRNWEDACEHIKAGGDYEIDDSEPIDWDD